MGFCKEKLNIIFQDWDLEHYFVIVTYNQKNIALNMGICEFGKDCEWWGYDDVLLEELDRELGWVFDKKDDKDGIMWQIDSFLRENDYLCKDEQ